MNIGVWAEKPLLCCKLGYSNSICVEKLIYCFLKKLRICYLMGRAWKILKKMFRSVLHVSGWQNFSYHLCSSFCKEPPHFYCHHTLASYLVLTNTYPFRLSVSMLGSSIIWSEMGLTNIDSFTKRILKAKCIYRMI